MSLFSSVSILEECCDVVFGVIILVFFQSFASVGLNELSGLLNGFVEFEV